MINADEQRIFPCQDCGLLRSKAEGGHIFTVCDGCWGRTFRSLDITKRLATLAHNLAIAGALCRAYTEGALQQAAALVAFLPRLPVDAVVANRITNRWWPGCNRSAP